MTAINWTKTEAGEHLAGDYRVVRKTGRYEVWNGQAEPIKKRLSLTEAKRFVEEMLTPVVDSTTVDPTAITYDDFIVAVRESGWTVSQIGGDEKQPDALKLLLETVGQTNVVEWIDRALICGDLKDGERSEPVVAPTVTKFKAGNASDPIPAKPAKAKVKDVQAIADELVWKSGKNAWNRGDLPDLLTEFDLTDADLNDLIRERAVENFSARLKRNLNAERLNWLPPVEGVSVTGQQTHSWSTECGQHKIIRVSGAEPRFMVVTKIDSKIAREREIANDLKNLREALERAEAWHVAQNGLSGVRSNKNSILAKAVELGLHKRPALPTLGTQPEGEERIMHVSEKKATAMLTAMGLPDVENWSMAKLTKTLNDIAAATDGAAMPDDKEHRVLFKKIRAANEAGTKISVGEVAASEKTKPGKNGKSAAKNTKPDKPSNGKSAVDAFGFRVGSRKAQIMSILSKAKNPMTVKEIREAGEIPGGYQEFLNELHEKKIVKGDQTAGWVLTK